MWWLIAVFVATLVLSFAFMPRPQSQNQKLTTLNDINAPTAEVGREISVLFGTRDLNGPNVTWYGALRLVAIKSKAGKK